MRISDWVQTCALPILLHPGAAIGPHRIAHDEVYYVLRRGRGGLRRRATGLEPGIGRLSVRRRGRRDHAAGRAPADADHRSEERRVGKEWVSTGRPGWSPSH